MTYARARLCLGICGVGSLVGLSAIALWCGLPQRQFSPGIVSPGSALKQLFALTVVVSALLVPFDFLGGFWLPRKFGKCRASLFTWLRTYLAAAAIQGFFFIGFGLLILSMGQAHGIFGAITAVLLGVGTGAWLRNFQISCRRGETSESNRKLVDALTLIQSWQVFVPRTIVVRHHDPGFTGGIIGLGKRLKIVIPQAWLRFSTEQLATLIARRAVAVETGSYRKGLIAAVLWNVIGFTVCSLLPGANLTSGCWFGGNHLLVYPVVVSGLADVANGQPQCVPTNRSKPRHAWSSCGLAHEFRVCHRPTAGRRARATSVHRNYFPSDPECIASPRKTEWRRPGSLECCSNNAVFLVGMSRFSVSCSALQRWSARIMDHASQ